MGFAAGAVAAAVLLALRALVGGPSLPELIQDGVVQLLPGPLFSAALDRLGFAAKPLLFAAILLGIVLVGGALEVVARALGAAAAAAAGWLLAGAVLLPLLGQGIFGTARPAEAPIWVTTAIGASAYAVVLRGLPASALAAGRHGARRRLLRLAGGAAAATALGVVGWRLSRPRLLPVERAPGDDHVTPEITPVGVFYNVSKNQFDPVVKAEGWTLAVDGLVERPFALTLDQLRALADLEQPATLCCISNPVGGSLIGNGVWRGVRVADLLARAGVRTGAVDVVLHAADGYQDSIPLGRAQQPGTLLALEMNGEALTDKHGFPARLLVPGIYGMKNVKWLRRIEVVDHDLKGYWQQVQGWSDDATYHTMSRIDRPEDGDRPRPDPLVLQGIAFGGDRGIARVEISADAGATWRDARLRPALGPLCWRRWELDWPVHPGPVTIVVRATDGAGARQTDTAAEPFPDGATGWHAIKVMTKDG